MELRASSISCGVRELISLGNEPLQRDLDYLLQQVKPNKMEDKTSLRITTYGGPHSCAMLIASVTEKQVNAIKLLEKNGFKRVGPLKRNPNSGNNIGLWVAYVQEDGKLEQAPVEVAQAPACIPYFAPTAYAAFKSERKILRDKRGRFARRKPEQLSWASLQT
jgi:hypothetical protein